MNLAETQRFRRFQARSEGWTKTLVFGHARESLTVALGSPRPAQNTTSGPGPGLSVQFFPFRGVTPDPASLRAAPGTRPCRRRHVPGAGIHRSGPRQIGEAHDEGDTATAFAECLPVVFQALTRSSLSGPERLLFAIDAELADDYDGARRSTEPALDAPAQPEDWSVVADTLAQRLETSSAREKPGADDFSRNYRRDRVTNWIATARRMPAATRSCGPSTNPKPGPRGVTNDSSGSCWSGSTSRTPSVGARGDRRDQCQAPGDRGESGREPLRSGPEAEAVGRGRRARRIPVLLRPSRPVHVRRAGEGRPEGRRRGTRARRGPALPRNGCPAVSGGCLAPRIRHGQGHEHPIPGQETGAATKSKPVATSPEPTPAVPVRVKIEPEWPLPLPDYLIPFLDRPGRYNPAPRPHLEVLLEMALAAERPDEVLRWFDKMQSAPRGPGSYQGPYGYGYSDRVAEAVSAAYPERAIAIYTAALNAQLPHAQLSAYESATANLRKLRSLYETSTGRANGPRWWPRSARSIAIARTSWIFSMVSKAARSCNRRGRGGSDPDPNTCPGGVKTPRSAVPSLEHIFTAIWAVPYRACPIRSRASVDRFTLPRAAGWGSGSDRRGCH